MHGNPHIIVFDKTADASEVGGKIFFPAKAANGVRRERNKIGCDSEKQDVILCVIFKNPAETRKIIRHNIFQQIFGIRLQSEAFIAPAGKGSIETGITDFH